jgi:hypothetical protein
MVCFLLVQFSYFKFQEFRWKQGKRPCSRTILLGAPEDCSWGGPRRAAGAVTRTPPGSRRLRAIRAPKSEGRQVGPEVEPTSAFYSCIFTGMHGPTCVVWANLTTFSYAQMSSGPIVVPSRNVPLGPRKEFLGAHAARGGSARMASSRKSSVPGHAMGGVLILIATPCLLCMENRE